MLNRLLHLLEEGGTRRVSDLAKELETTPELVEVMLEDLTRMGYVKPVTSECSDKCATCPMSDACAAGDPSASGGGRVWVLSDD